MNIEAKINFKDVDILGIIRNYIEYATYNEDHFKEAICDTLGYNLDTIININEVAKECLKELTKIFTFNDN